MTARPGPEQLFLFPELIPPALRDLAADLAGGEDEDDDPERRQHDLVLKTAIEHFFGDLVRLTEPDFAARVDLDNVEFLPQESFSDFPSGRRRIADVVAKLTSNDGERRIVLVQAEVEDDFRTAMDKRSFFYFMYLRIKYDLPVLMIVVFLKGGQEALEMREFVDEAEGVEVCRFRYVALCLSQNRAEDFVDRPQPLASALAAFMKSGWDPVEKKLRCLRAIRHADVDEARRFILATIVELYVELDEAQTRRYEAVLEQEGNKEVRDMVITWEDALASSRAEGKTEGKTEGKAEGRAEGFIEATRSHIVRVLERRLKTVPAFVGEKLDAIRSLKRLEEILDQAVVVSSVDELVLEP